MTYDPALKTRGPAESPPRIVDNRGKRRGVQGAALLASVVDETVQVRACRICACTEAEACEGGCDWAEADLCTRCQARIDAQVVAQQRVADDVGRRERLEDIRVSLDPNDSFVDSDLAFLVSEVDRLRAGDDTRPVEPGTWPTAGQWLQHLTEQDREGRLQLAGRALEDAQELYAINSGLAEMRQRQQAEQIRALFGNQGAGGLVVPR